MKVTSPPNYLLHRQSSNDIDDKHDKNSTGFNKTNNLLITRCLLAAAAVAAVLLSVSATLNAFCACFHMVTGI